MGESAQYMTPGLQRSGIEGILRLLMNLSIFVAIAAICICVVLLIEKYRKKDFHKIFKTFVFWFAIEGVFIIFRNLSGFFRYSVGTIFNEFFSYQLLPLLLLIAVGAVIDGIAILLKKLIKKEEYISIAVIAVVAILSVALLSISISNVRATQERKREETMQRNEEQAAQRKIEKQRADEAKYDSLSKENFRAIYEREMDGGTLDRFYTITGGYIEVGDKISVNGENATVTTIEKQELGVRGGDMMYTYYEKVSRAKAGDKCHFTFNANPKALENENYNSRKKPVLTYQK